MAETPPASGAPVEDEFSLYYGAQLMASDETQLGELTTAAESFDSVCNPDGDYGSAFSGTSIFNPDSPYGGEFGEQSPFNLYSDLSPAIVVGGETVGYLTVSPFAETPVDPYGLLESLGCPVAGH